ncbi:hypothetical protein ACQP25_33750 [Microtetraspora malaysiensis]|uniref:hypothetical protein n=1 Tax=Microtetraspora malaysiensis TaxID=161358 RepID=UPI003D8EA279
MGHHAVDLLVRAEGFAAGGQVCDLALDLDDMVSPQRSPIAPGLEVKRLDVRTLRSAHKAYNDVLRTARAPGLGIPVVVLLFVNSALASREPFRRGVETLRAEGVHVLLGPGQFEPHAPSTGADVIDTYPWHLAIAQTIICATA